MSVSRSVITLHTRIQRKNRSLNGILLQESDPQDNYNKTPSFDTGLTKLN